MPYSSVRIHRSPSLISASGYSSMSSVSKTPTTKGRQRPNNITRSAAKSTKGKKNHRRSQSLPPSSLDNDLRSSPIPEDVKVIDSSLKQSPNLDKNKIGNRSVAHSSSEHSASTNTSKQRQALHHPQTKEIKQLSKMNEQAIKNAISELKKAQSRDGRIGAITNACVEFDHWDEHRHAIELKFGADKVFTKILSGTSDDDEIRMICSALEMVFRASSEALKNSYFSLSESLVPVLLRLLEKCENGNLRNADVSITNISKVFLYFSRVEHVRESFARSHGLLPSLTRVSTSILNDECRVLRLRIMANLANEEQNKFLLVEHKGLLDAVLRIANLDLSEKARQYAAATLMDLTVDALSRLYMAKNDKVLAVLVKLSLFDDENPETREHGITALQNMAYSKENRMRMITFGSGMVLEALRKNIISNPFTKSRRRAAGTLTNLACDTTAEILGCHGQLLHTLAIVSKKDGKEEVRTRAALALTKIGYHITIDMKCNTALLDALAVAASVSCNASSVLILLRAKAKSPENRQAYASHKGVLTTLCRLSSSESSNPKDRENAVRAIMHLTNCDFNKKLLASQKHVLEALVHCASSSEEPARDSAIIALQRLATEIPNRRVMAHHDGLLVCVADATERECKEERKGIKATRERLAKPLLMSLLLSM